ncbi:MAG: hypothetical protein KatS3mg027_0772 [Bacteroidia bacterium]|nr:MAG: hypothetical protein KatS3mg027_0772 [Bacteroidia bacterium]
MKKLILILGSTLMLNACQQANPPHGEEGHQCTEECKILNQANSHPADNNNVDLKEHVCTQSCSKEEHVYLHGEEGHECGDECLKFNQ